MGAVGFCSIPGFWDIQTLVPGHPDSIRWGLPLVEWASSWSSYWLATSTSSVPLLTCTSFNENTIISLSILPPAPLSYPLSISSRVPPTLKLIASFSLIVICLCVYMYTHIYKCKLFSLFWLCDYCLNADQSALDNHKGTTPWERLIILLVVIICLWVFFT